MRILYTSEEAERILQEFTPEERAEIERLAQVFLKELSSEPRSRSGE